MREIEIEREREGESVKKQSGLIPPINFIIHDMLYVLYIQMGKQTVYSSIAPILQISHVEREIKRLEVLIITN